MKTILLTRAELLEQLRVSNSWWSRNRSRLEQTLAFPPPVPGFGRRWNRRAVHAWMNRHMPSDLRAPMSETEAAAHWEQTLLKSLT